jgi:Tfp pilus assembly protein PilX
MRRARKGEQGFSLLVALIMLVVMLLFALTVFDLGRSSVQIVGNMQNRNQSLSAASGTIEDAISRTTFFKTPAAVFLKPCKGPNTKCFDVNGSGKNDILVTLTPNPTCTKAKVIPNAFLDLSQVNDAGCAQGVQQTQGIRGSVTGYSLCSDSLWELRAVASDTVSETSATVTQGVSVRVSTDNIAAACP